MTAYAADVLTLARKDLRLELRARDTVPAMVLFSVTVFVLFHFGVDRRTLEGDLASGVLWVTLLLAAVLAVNRLFASERDQGGIPLSKRVAVTLAKAPYGGGGMVVEFAKW